MREPRAYRSNLRRPALIVLLAALVAAAIVAVSAVYAPPSTNNVIFAQAQEQGATGQQQVQGSTAQTAPGTPSSVTVTRADATLTASWPAVDGATSYHVTYSSDGKQSWSLAALDHPADGNTTNGVTSITFDVDNAKTYVVGVRAKNEHGGSGWRNSPSAGPFTPPDPDPTPTPTPAPGTPSSVAVTRADGSLTASWDAVSGATSYHVTYSSDGKQSWSLAALDHPADGNTSNGVTSITFNVSNGSTYVVGVRAKNAGGGSGWRNSASAGPFTPPTPERLNRPEPTPEPTPTPNPPGAPTGLTATAGDGSATMTWNNPGDASITGYRYQQREDGGAWGAHTPIEGSGAGTTSHQVTGLAHGTTYHFNLQALNAGGASAAAQAQATLPGLIPGPANITVTRSAGTLTVSWDAISGAYRYWVDSFNHSDGYINGEHYKTTTSTSITLTGVNDSLNYLIRLSARGDFGRTAFSWSAPAGTLTSPPLAPASVSISRSGPTGPLAASWPAVVGAASYNVNISGDRGKTWARQADNHTGTTWTVNTIDADTDYIIAVQTKNNADVSGWTNSPVNTPLPPAPASVTVSSRTGATLNVTWSAVTNATSYNVRSSADDGATWSAASGVTTGTSTALTLDAAKDYVVGVQAVNGKGTSAWTVSAESLATPVPPAPTNVSDTRGKGTIRLTWDASSGAATYEVACNAYSNLPICGTNCATGITDANRSGELQPRTTTGSPEEEHGPSGTTRDYHVRGAGQERRRRERVDAATRRGRRSPTGSPASARRAPTTTSRSPGRCRSRKRWIPHQVHMDVQCRTSSDGGTTWSSWFNCADQIDAQSRLAGSTFRHGVIDSQDSYDSTLTYQARVRSIERLGLQACVSGASRRSSTLRPALPPSPTT